MINSLIENDNQALLDAQSNEDQFKLFGSHQFTEDNINKFTKAEEELLRSFPLDKGTPSEDPMDFMQVIKQQNQQIGQMMEIGERNAHSVQQMFNDIFSSLVKNLGSQSQTETPLEAQSLINALQHKLEENRIQ